MAGGDAAGEASRLVRDVAQRSEAGFGGPYRKDCTDLSRRVALLAHLFDEIKDFESSSRPSDSTAAPAASFGLFSDLTLTIQAVKRLLSAADNFDSKISSVSLFTLTGFCYIRIL